MEKEISITGPQGNFKGKVIVYMNHSSEMVKGTHAGTHDDYEKKVQYHYVEAWANGQKLLGEKTNQESTLITLVQRAEDEVTRHLSYLSTTKPELTAQQILQNKGYK